MNKMGKKIDEDYNDGTISLGGSSLPIKIKWEFPKERKISEEKVGDCSIEELLFAVREKVKCKSKDTKPKDL